MLKDDQNPQAMLTLENFSSSIGASVVSVAVQAKQGAKMNEVFQQLQSKFFNELIDGYTKPNDACKNIEDWLANHTLDELQKLNQIAKAHFLYEGITFAVYGDAEGIERTIPYDLIPRVIEKKQWNKVASGCVQRVRALNAFLHDIYHQQDILKAKIVPELQV